MVNQPNKPIKLPLAMTSHTAPVHPLPPQISSTAFSGQHRPLWDHGITPTSSKGKYTPLFVAALGKKIDKLSPILIRDQGKHIGSIEGGSADRPVGMLEQLDLLFIANNVQAKWVLARRPISVAKWIVEDEGGTFGAARTARDASAKIEDRKSVV